MNIDTIVATLRQAYPTATLACDATKALLDAIVDVILTQTFVDHTADDLANEDMDVAPHLRHIADNTWFLCLLHYLTV